MEVDVTVFLVPDGLVEIWQIQRWAVIILYFTLRMHLSPRLLATWLHYHQLREGVSILGQRTLSDGTTLWCGPSSAAHHIDTCLKRSGTTSADWLHTTQCSYGSGSAMTMCGGVIRSPVAGQSCRIPVPCWPRLRNLKLLATSFFYIRSGQVQPQWFSGTKPGWWVSKHIVVDWPVSGWALSSLWEHQLRLYVAG